MEETLSPGPNSGPWTFPSTNSQMQKHTVLSLMQAAPFTYHFTKEKNGEALGNLESLHALHRGAKWGPERIPRSLGYIQNWTPEPKFSALLQLWSFHPTVGWQCRVLGSLWPKKSHNGQTVTKLNQQVWFLWHQASSLIFSSVRWYAF